MEVEGKFKSDDYETIIEYKVAMKRQDIFHSIKFFQNNNKIFRKFSKKNQKELKGFKKSLKVLQNFKMSFEPKSQTQIY